MKHAIVRDAASSRLWLLLVCLWAVGAQQVPAQVVVYVDHTATAGAGSGSSWDDAYVNLKVALLQAPAGAELRIADGTYLPDQGTGLQATTFGIAKSLSLLGGYAGVGAPDPDHRDVEGTPTVLSGDLAEDDGPGFTNRSDNVEHVLTLIDGYVLMDGLTVRGGNATPSSSNSFGGGVYAVGGDTALTARYCVFTDNEAGLGGGLYVAVGGDLEISDSDFLANRAVLNGGGAVVFEGQTAAITACRFFENQAGGNGGGLHINGGLTTDSTFDSNSAERGGGVFAQDNDAHPRFESCVFTRNNALTGGGGAYGNGGGDYWYCTFFDNAATAGSGGGVRNSYNPNTGAGSARWCVVFGNSASDNGGGINGAAVSHCTVFGNTAGMAGGGVYGAVTQDEVNFSVSHSILWGNDVAGVIDFSAQMDAWIDPQSVGQGDGPYLTYSCVTGVHGSPFGIASNLGNFDADPLFEDQSGADGAPGTEDDDFHLSAGSPCIDAGLPGCLDPDGTVCDVGAFYYEQVLPPPPPPPWTDLGFGLAGTSGVPVLIGTGVNASGQQAGMELSDALPFSLGYLVLGYFELAVPFKGGVLVPNPDKVVIAVVDGFGETSLSWTWSPGIPPGALFWCQMWVPDPGGPKGFAASNGLRGETSD